MSVSRDPETGKFVSGSDLDRFDRIRHWHAEQNLTVDAADVGGQTGSQLGQETVFEAVDLLDFEELMDRDEVAVMLWAEFALVTYIASTQTADGTIRTALEYSFSPDRKAAGAVGPGDPIANTGSGGRSDFPIDLGDAPSNITGDVIGRHLAAVGHGPITDGTNGVGGAGTAGTDKWQGSPFDDSVIDDRDTLFLNGAMEHSNVSDASLHADTAVWLVLGIISD